MRNWPPDCKTWRLLREGGGTPGMWKNLAFAWHHRWGANAYVGGLQRVALTATGDAKNIYDESVGLIRQWPANALGWGAPQEPARTNALLYSLDFSQAAWSKRGTAAYSAGQADPLGGAGATRLTINSSTNDIYQVVVYAAGSKLLATSVWMKRVSASGTIQIRNPGDAGNGDWSVNLAGLPDRWVRLTATSPYVSIVQPFSSTAGPTGGIHFMKIGAGAVSFDVWNPQQEYDAAYPTSDIPTGAAGVSRAADAVRLINAGLFGPLAREGSVLWVGSSPEAPAVGLDKRPWALTGADGVSDAALMYVGGGSNAWLGRIISNSTTTAVITGPVASPAANVVFATMLTWRLNSVNWYANGTRYTEDTSAAMPTSLDRLEISGQNPSTTRGGFQNFLVACFDRALTSAEAQALTASPEAPKWAS